MTVPIFVDTNVLVYRHDATEPGKQPRAAEWLTFLWRTRSGTLSYQVLQELYVTLTHKLNPGMAAADAQQLVRDLVSWQPVATDLPVLERAWGLHARHALSWWDALIVAAARSVGCRVLLTEDLQHGQSFGALRVVNPFEAPGLTPVEIVDSLSVS